MLGAIAGDMIGSVYEADPVKAEDFPLWSTHSRATDDSVLSIAVAEAAMGDRDYAAALRRWARRYPNAGYGARFYDWMRQDAAPSYGSWGNGSAMRVASIGWLFDSEEAVLREAAASAAPTHDHPEGIRGAQTIALAVYLARRDITRKDLRLRLRLFSGYDLDRRLEDIRPDYGFDVSCQGSVPEALIAFFASTSVEDAIRKAVSLGGDADTQACMAGAVAEAFFDATPPTIERELRARLPADMTEVLECFLQRCPRPGIAHA